MPKPSDSRLTQEQETFCLVYVRTGDRSGAYRASGGTGKDAYKGGDARLRGQRVKARISELRAEAADKITTGMAATEEEVLSDIRWACKMAKRGNVVLDKNGKALRDEDGAILRRPDLQSVLKSAELLARTQAMFTDKQKVVNEMEGKSDQELSDIIQSAIESNPMLVEKIAGLEIVRDRVKELVDAAPAAPDAYASPSRMRH
jgi:hypothetical protein